MAYRADYRPRKSNDSKDNRNYFSNVTKFVGLVNLGNTCYMNSLLQTLYMIPEFRNAVLGIDFTNFRSETANNRTLKELQNLFVEMTVSKDRSCSTRQLFRTLDPGSAMLGVQRDLLDERRTLFSLLRQPSGWPYLDDLFRGKQDRCLRCTVCKDVTVCSSSFEDIQAPVYRSDGSELKDNLVDCLKCLTKITELNGENAFTCLHCNEPTPTLSQCVYTKMPKILFIQLMRFVINRHLRNYSKIDSRVEFSTDGLNFANIFQKIDGREQPYPEYELLSVVVHTGTVQYGHYFAYIRDPSDNQWYCFNDSSVTRATVDDVKRTFGGSNYDPCAYCLVYRRIDSDVEDFKPLDAFPHLRNKKPQKMFTDESPYQTQMFSTEETGKRKTQQVYQNVSPYESISTDSQKILQPQTIIIDDSPRQIQSASESRSDPRHNESISTGTEKIIKI